jgi:aryl-alcohol dehydrogenase-like predicted oxidoreductase
MHIRNLGNTGVRVSELCLGAMNFGMADWGTGAEESRRIIDAYIEAGGNFIDTADVYSKGSSETICGKALKGRRHGIILATKGHFPVTARFGEAPEHENAWGSTRRHLTQALHDSLRRLQTDYIDLYQVHCWDDHTPIEETLSTLNDFIRTGKARYVGLSNFDSWQIAEARQLCIRFGWEPFVTAQMQYSLVCRDIETGVVPVCRRYVIGILPWSPLGGGVLTGKYAPDGRGPKGCRFGEKPDEQNFWRQRFVNDRNLRTAETVSAVAREQKATAAAVALAWLLGRPMVSSIIIGPRSIRQLKENMAACEVRLTAAQIKRLDEVSAPAAPYPAEFIAKTRRNMPEENAE